MTTNHVHFWTGAVVMAAVQFAEWDFLSRITGLPVYFQAGK